MRHYGLHRHFTGGSSVLLFGGGMKRGFLYGATAEERPCVAIENPVSVTDLHATILTAMGISPTDGVRRREAAVLRDGRRQGQMHRRAVRLTSPLDSDTRALRAHSAQRANFDSQTLCS